MIGIPCARRIKAKLTPARDALSEAGKTIGDLK